MATYSIYGDNPPPGTYVLFSDGNPSIILGETFYKYGGDLPNGRCIGGRVWCPADITLPTQVTIMAWSAPTGVRDAQYNLDTPPLRSVTVNTVHGGWAEATWEPFDLPDDGLRVMIGYRFAGFDATKYLHASLATTGSTISYTGTKLARSEAIDESPERGPVARLYYRIGGNPPQKPNQDFYYGIDILVDDGPGSEVPQPIAEYGFNEESGTVAADTSGNDRHLTINSADNLSVGMVGGGLHQVGGGSANKISQPVDWLSTPHRTLMFWGRRGSEGADTWSRSVYQVDSSDEIVFGVALNDNEGKVFFNVKQAGNNTFIVTPEQSIGTWHHYALTYDQQEVKAYLDGVLVQSIAATGSIDESDGNLYIFGDDYQQQVIDDLRFFDTALTEEQLNSYMNDHVPPSDTEPPSAPTNLTVEASGQDVTLTWGESTDNVETQNYIVYRGNTADFVADGSSQIAGPALATFLDVGRPPGIWYYKVAARDEAGNISVASNEVSIEIVIDTGNDFLYPSQVGWELGSTYTELSADGITLGTLFALSAPAPIKGGRFYSPVSAVGATVRLWEHGIPVAGKSGVDLTSGWNLALFAEPFIGAAGIDYIISIHLPGPGAQYTARTGTFSLTRTSAGPAYSQTPAAGKWTYGNAHPTNYNDGVWYGVDAVVGNESSEIIPGFGATIAEENSLEGASGSEWSISGAGDVNNVGFVREFSVNAGGTVDFSCHGAGTIIDIYRIGSYGGLGWRRVARLDNAATTQPESQIIPDSNGGTTCSNWSITASWNVPQDALSGLFVGVYRNEAGNNASYIPFVVRNDEREADIIIKTSETTWALAYNYYNSPSSPLTGKSVYGSGGPLGNISTRAHAVSYHRPIVTRSGISQTYWLACEAPLIRFAEANGLNVKYVASKDLDRDPSVLNNSKILISSGHDEYWSIGMRDAAEAYRDSGKHILFMSGNEVFWRTRFSSDYSMMWCYKDTMDGPDTHIGGTQLDPVSWTGTWKDTRFDGRKPENTLTGTDFRMNGVNDHPAALLQAADYASHPVWRNSSLSQGDVTLQGVIGFEADRMLPTQPAESTAILASSTININGSYADDNGQSYSGNGDLDWGIVSQRYASGAVVVGFGTCQWSWALDSVHDRGGNYVHPAARQFMVNLFADLGASAQTLQTGLAAPTPVSLDNYGLVPSGDFPQIDVFDKATGKWVRADILGVGEGGDLTQVETADE